MLNIYKSWQPKFWRVGLFIGLLCAGSLTVQANKVLKISEARIEKLQSAFASRDNTRNKLRLTSKGLSIAAAGVFLWYLLKDSPEVTSSGRILDHWGTASEDEKKQVRDTLAVGMARLEIIKKQEQRDAGAPAAPWYRRWWTWAKQKTPIVAAGFVTQALWNKGFEIFYLGFPGAKLSDYYFAQRTISWFIENNTVLVNNVEDLVKCVQKLNDPELSQDAAEEIASIMNLLVSQIEKILAYISHVTQELPESHKVERVRSQIIQKQIKSLTNKLADMTEKLITVLEKEEDGSGADNIDLSSYIKLTNTICNQLESFAAIEAVLGYEDVGPRTIFDSLHYLLSPKKSLLGDPHMDQLMQMLQGPDVAPLA